MDFSSVMTIARQEARVNIRNKWTLTFAAAFGLLALAISYFGLVTTGAVGFQGFERTTASLMSLVLYLVPNLSLMLATLSLTADRGSGELLFSQPVSRTEILTGKLLGLFSTIVIATLFGFGLAGSVIAFEVGVDGLPRFAGFVGLSLLLSLVFLALGALISVAFPARSRAFGTSLFVWFFFVLFYDLLVIGAAFMLPERTANTVIFASLFGNPVDMIRVGGMMLLGDSTVFGAAGAALIKFLGGRAPACAALLVGTLLWIVLPLLLANRKLKRQDL